MMIDCDSFNTYSGAFFAKMWDVVSVPVLGGTSITQGLTSGRFGSGGVVFVGPKSASSTLTANVPQYIQRNYNGVSTIICGLAIQQTGTQVVNGARFICFLDGATVQVSLEIMPSGQIRATRSTLAGQGIYLSTGFPFDPTYTVLGMSTDAISSSSYDFLEIKIVHHSTNGSIEILRNGEAFWALSSVNTAVSGSNNSSSVLIGGYSIQGAGASSSTVRNYLLNATVSDFHLLNTSVNGSDALDPVDFIGDRHWEAVLPTTDGHYAEWTPDPTDPGDPSEHAQNVNTIPPNTARNNNTETVGARDTFNCDDATGPVAASVILAYQTYLEKNTGGAVGVSGIFRLSGSDRNGTEYQVPNPAAFRKSFLCSKPGGGAITIANVNNGEHGYERTS